MSKPTKEIVNKSKTGFVIQQGVVPPDLQPIFANEVRVNQLLPNNGYIIFDSEMLASVLRSKDAAKQAELAAKLEKMANLGAKLVVMKGMQG